MEDEIVQDTVVEEIKFKPKKKKNLRQRIKEDDDSEDEQYILAKLEETKVLQKLRERPNGVSVVALATGQKTTLEEEITCKDPFKVKSGGMVNMQALKSGKVKQVDDAYDTGIGTQFSAETNKRDEDEEMMKYIEEQLAKRKGILLLISFHLSFMQRYIYTRILPVMFKFYVIGGEPIANYWPPNPGLLRDYR